MHQRHNIRHNVHQPSMIRAPHIPSQINVSIASHPQQLNIQQQIPTQPSQQTQQHTNIAIGTATQIMSQYIPTAPTGHQRGDLSRLGLHLPTAPQQHQQTPPPQGNLQQPHLAQPTQRINSQMHPTHYMKNRPPNINNSNHGGVNLNTKQHLQIQPPPQTAAKVNNQQIQHQLHHQQIPPPLQQQQSQHQVSSHHNKNNISNNNNISSNCNNNSSNCNNNSNINNNNNNSNNNNNNNNNNNDNKNNNYNSSNINNNNYNQNSHHGNKVINHQIHKYSNIPINGGEVIFSHSKTNQSKNSVQPISSTSQHQLQNQSQPLTNQSQNESSQFIQSQQQGHQQSQVKSTTSQQLINQSQFLNQSSSETVCPANQIQIEHTKIIQHSSKISNITALNNSISSAPLVNSINSGNSKVKCNHNLTLANSQGKPIIKNSSVGVTQISEKQTQKCNKQNSPSTSESETNILSSENEIIESISSESFGINSTDNISSGKEKTPMCLVNELARYNQIQHQYRLTGEQGPAHSKRFTVILKLGDEEYTAEGLSIKKAQHTAAAEAIIKTKYEQPPPKKIRHKNGSTRFGIGNITPTVELNALAMKLGEKAVYIFDSAVVSQKELGNINYQTLSPPINQTNFATPISLNQQIISNGTHPSIPPTANSNGAQHPSIPHIPNYYCESNYQYGQFNSRNNLVNIYLNNEMRFPTLTRRPYARSGYMKFRNRMMTPFSGVHSSFHKDACKITLLVGKQKFIGLGSTVQAAKHDAASKALEVLKLVAENSENNENLNVSTGDSEFEIKSPISLVYEIGLKRNLQVTFEVKSEIGPPHLKNFITICKAGEITTEGEGNGKKVSKKRAAKKMLEELKKLPPLSPEKSPPANTYQNNNNKSTSKGNRAHKRNVIATTTQSESIQQASIKKRTKNVAKDKSESENLEEINPISRLIQIQQAIKDREPVYTVVEEKGAPRRREFTIEVTANGQSARGNGTNKKIAKKNAAKNLLIVLGYEPNATNKENNSNIIHTVESNSNVKSSDIDTLPRSNNSNSIPNTSKTNQQTQSGSSSRQIVPGLLHLPKNQNNVSAETNGAQSPNSNESEKIFRKEEFPNESSNESNNKNKESERKSTDFGVRPKDQLLYLAQLLGFDANFTDYPKGNHGEYLTIVALFTDPPQLCHGAGENTDASQDNAALAALQMLSKLGLDNVKPKKPQPSSTNLSTDDKQITNATKN